MTFTSVLENLWPWRTDPGSVPPAVLLGRTCLEWPYYDTGGLTPEEVAQVLRLGGAHLEGGMVYVRPAGQRGEIEGFERSDALMTQHADLAAVTVAGVGSSVVGTAALARQVANAISKPVAGVVAGYGLSDAAAEGWGGFFVFGMRNIALSSLAAWRKLAGIEFTEDQKKALRDKYDIKTTRGLIDEPDMNTLLNILMHDNCQVKLVVGHSKGAMCLQTALGALEEKLGPDVAKHEHMAVVTLGCAVELPDVYDNVHQHLGCCDPLGILNTPRTEMGDPDFHWSPWCGHTLRRSNPAHMPVTEIIEEAWATVP